MENRIVLTETKDFFNCAQIFSAKFRDMDLVDIENENQTEFQSYANVGYNSFLFNRDLATIYIRKVEIKTIDNIFETDMYGLLN